MLGVVLDLGSDGSYPQFPESGTIDKIYGPIELKEFKKLMKKFGGAPLPDKKYEYVVGERAGFPSRTICMVRFVFAPLTAPTSELDHHLMFLTK